MKRLMPGSDCLLNDFRIALRQHLRQLAFSLTVVCTLGLTVAATTAVFSVVNSVLIRNLPFASSDHLMWIVSVRPDNPNAPFSLPEFIDYRNQTRTLSGLAAYANWSASLAEGEITERLDGMRISANAFDVLGISPAAGRLLEQSDDRPDAPLVAVLSYRLWQRQFGESADAIGKIARINGDSYVIVGVLPRQFRLPFLDVDIVTALAPDRDRLRHVRNSVNFLRFFGRINPGTSADRAQAELNAICRSLRQQFPVEYAGKEAVKVIGLHEALVGNFRMSMLLLFCAVLVVLATALANVVSLVLVRANARRQEVSIRIAVGGSWLHFARQLAIESSLLAFAGSVVGWLIALQAISAVKRWAPPSIPRLNEISLDGTVVFFVVTLTVLVTGLLTLAPLGAIAQIREADSLRSTSRTIGDRWNRRVRNAMVAGEISAALVLLLATIVVIQNLIHLREVKLGFTPDLVFQARLAIPATYRSTDDVARFYERLSNRLAAAPAVAQVGVISVAPLSGLIRTVPFSVVDQLFAERGRPSANLRAISAGYLSAVGTRLVKGRSFSENDRSDTPPVALVSAALAERFISGSAVGRRLLINDNTQGPRPVEIVGVVENVQHAGLDLPPALDVYIPLRQIHPDGIQFFRDSQFWMIKTHSHPEQFRSTFLAQLREVDPDAALAGTSTMQEYLESWLGPRRFNLGLFGAFALTAMLLAFTGVYGLVSYSVSQRRTEIGVRMAIGATRRNVQQMILRQAVTLGIAGAAIGLALSGAAQSLIAGMVQEVAINPLVAIGTAALLIAVVLMAAWLPARRAAQIDPTLALKAQ